MVQKALPLRNYKQTAPVASAETVQALGVHCEDSMVTLRFMAGDVGWGRPAKQIRLNRDLAEQLSRLLADELEDYA